MVQGGVSAQSIVALLETHLSSISTAELSLILRELGRGYEKLTSVGYDKPKIPNTPEDQALLERLKRDGIVNSYDSSATLINVHKKRK